MNKEESERDALRGMIIAILDQIAQQARSDAHRGDSNIASIFRHDRPQFAIDSMDIKVVEEAIADVKKATATKQGAQKLIDGIILAAKIAANLT